MTNSEEQTDGDHSTVKFDSMSNNDQRSHDM
jgi:hypothetical protein